MRLMKKKDPNKGKVKSTSAASAPNLIPLLILVVSHASLLDEEWLSHVIVKQLLHNGNITNVSTYF